MDLKEFMAFASEIENLPLDDRDRECRVVRLLDLERFLRVCIIPLDILDRINYPVVIALDQQLRIGIMFIDIASETNTFHNSQNQDNGRNVLLEFGIDTLWTVLVSEKQLTNAGLSEITKAIESNNLQRLDIENLFLLDFQNHLLYQATYESGLSQIAFPALAERLTH